MEISKVIAALRDTAQKATETKEVTRPNDMINHGWSRDAPSIVIEHVEAYSKDWIAGRLLGMADTLEAMTKGEE